MCTIFFLSHILRKKAAKNILVDILYKGKGSLCCIHKLYLYPQDMALFFLLHIARSAAMHRQGTPPHKMIATKQGKNITSAFFFLSKNICVCIWL